MKVSSTYQSQSFGCLVAERSASRSNSSRKILALLLDDVTYGVVNESDDWGVQFGSDIFIGEYANSEPFIGCIADLIINEKVQSFRDMNDYLEAEFGVCRLDSIVGVPVVIPPPSIVDEQDSATTVSPESCALLPPDNDGVTEEGFQFGNEANSRIELRNVSVFDGEFRKRGSIKMSIKTESEDGILYYAAGAKDFLTVYLASGKVVFTFDCGSGAVVVRGSTFVNDGTWHKIEAYRYQNNGSLTVDDALSMGIFGKSKDINRIKAPQYIGGVPQEVPEKHVPFSSQIGFVGCLKDFSAVVKDNAIAVVDQNPVKFDVTPCGAEQGLFVQNGYLVLIEEEKVGKMFDVEFEMKPRVTDGVLMSVRTGKYFFVVEIVEGTVIARASNGEQPFEASSKHLGMSICDGQWHNVTVEKRKSTITLTVDGILTEEKLRGAQEKSARTTDALYVGGIPDVEPVDHTSSEEQFVGCLKNIKINGETIILSGKKKFGNVSIDSCPVG
ncbi:laminin subunit alpha-4-like [Anneissia japonica]|uniref:laminin subunit alpha-4-like n=1 Tax=Anneissia japonica TaxID=1529436 RepID=UPI001425896E|nr:laminin subunit alpha-4-like [Anneissia japonica]